MTRRNPQPRREFPESVKCAALERAGWRCQDPLCGRSEEWMELRTMLRQIHEPLVMSQRGDGIWRLADVQWEGGIDSGLLSALRDAILLNRNRYPKLLNPIIRRFKLFGFALLEVDHEREDADGGEPVLANAIVRCVFCHQFKTLARANTRRRAPKKQPGPEQLKVLDTAVIAQLKGKIQPETAGPSNRGMARVVTLSSNEDGAKPRRHYSDEQVTAAAQRREQAAADYPWGV